MNRLLALLATVLWGASALLCQVPAMGGAKGGEPRVALVIGNASYRDAPLKNPVNDARAVEEVLRECGFQVTRLENVDFRRFTESVRAFRSRLAAGRGTGLFYFAGHGVSLGGKNYLLPVGEPFESEGDVEFRALEAGYVLRAMEEAGARVSILMLDACRNNPFGNRSFSRGGDRGLAVMEPPRGSLVSFATAPGQVAADGDGANGIYTQELVRTIREQPEVEVEQLLKTVGARVSQASGGKQVPYRSSSLTDSFYFRGQEASPPIHTDHQTAEVQAPVAIRLPRENADIGCSMSHGLSKGLVNSRNRNLYAAATAEAMNNHPGLRYNDIDSMSLGLDLAAQLQLAGRAGSRLLARIEYLGGTTVFSWTVKITFYCVASGQELLEWKVDSTYVRAGWTVKKELYNPDIHQKLQEAAEAVRAGCPAA